MPALLVNAALRFIEIGLCPIGGKQELVPAELALAELQQGLVAFIGHAGHDAFIPIADGKSSPQQQQQKCCEPQPKQGSSRRIGTVINGPIVFWYTPMLFYLTAE